MSEPARKNLALDLDDLERQLRMAAQPVRPGQPVDPLVELTRIVGSDDPLKDLFAQPRQAQPQPVQPAARPQPTQIWPQADTAAPVPATPPQDLRGALDEFEALLRRTEIARPEPAAAPVAPARVAPVAAPVRQEPSFEQALQQQDDSWTEPVRPAVPMARDLDAARPSQPYVPAAPAAREMAPEPAYDPAYDELPAGILPDEPDMVEPRRSRRGLWVAAAAIAIAVTGVGAAMTMRGGSTPVASSGAPPLITADSGPVKVQPENPGGTEIPNQNKQIYERTAEATPAETRVVTREEQPLDVQQAARQMRVEQAASATTSTNPLAQAPAAPGPVAAPSAEPGLVPVPPIPGLGEPRRVRTVTIRPDGSPVTEPARVAAAEPASPLSTASVPARPAATPQIAQPRQAQQATPPATPAPPVRVAAAPPTPSASATPAPATAAVRAGTGDFAVQLAAPGSESEARATFAALQRKYSQLAGHSPIVRKTDLAGGKTVYRLRIGPFSRDDATRMCSQLQSAGGQCFVARN